MWPRLSKSSTTRTGRPGAGNYVRYFPSGEVVANALNLTNGRSSLALQSQNPAVRTSPLNVTFANFELAEIAKAVQQSDSLVAGTLNGKATLNNLGKPTRPSRPTPPSPTSCSRRPAIGDMAVQATNPSRRTATTWMPA
ncbi:MAG: hypothetical protein WKG07_29680 [Hymenobacter sp.]